MLLALLLSCAHPAPPATVPVPPGASAAPMGPSPLPDDWAYGAVSTVRVEPTDPTTGPADARFTIVVFTDFFCPYCAGFAPKLHALAERNSDVRVVYKNWPIDKTCNSAVTSDRHRGACLAAAAAECAAAQGAFPAMADQLYTYPEHVTLPEIPTFADRVGIDRGAFEACLASPATNAAVVTDVQAGIDAGVDGTPGVFVSGLPPAPWVLVKPDIAVLEAVLSVARK